MSHASGCQTAQDSLRKRVELSIVIPVGSGDDAWRSLLPDLVTIPACELVVSATTPPGLPERDALDNAFPGRWRWIAGRPGRAQQLNGGATDAAGTWLWFLHADTRVTATTLAALRAALRDRSRTLFHFDLAFAPDGPRIMWVNALGARVRSNLLGMPFGDQGFLVRRELFHALGGYDESLAYGEDHVFAWRARVAGVRVRSTGGTLLTSARRYRDAGWAQTTLRFARLTWRQAIPQWWLLVRTRTARSR